MCGIAGIIDLQESLQPADREKIVLSMNTAILHRGPDDSGQYFDACSSLAMRRLSIIDTGGGKQPIFNETGSVCVLFNGEIYNYKSLRKQLECKSHQFKTNSDTEVLVHMYEEYGTLMFQMLEGMFSICLYDIEKKVWIIARDRFGEKPLFYHYQQSIFSFSSEIGSLLQNTYIPRKFNHDAFPYYLRTSLVPEPLTMLQDIYSLEPGHFIKITTKGIKKTSYFQTTYKANPKISSEAQAVEQIKPILENAVRKQMVSDVPIGAFLSGGIDSSTVVALMQKQSDQQIQTFNVKFENQAYDESAIAKKVAEHCGTDHHEICIPDFDFNEEIFWKIVDHVGLPFRDSSAIPSYLISQKIAEYVKVALSGDGGDELFGGYQIFQWHEKILRLKKISRPVRKFVNNGMDMAQGIPGLDQLSILRKLKRGLDTSFESAEDIPIALNAMFSEEEVLQLINTDIVRHTYPKLKDYLEIGDSVSSLRKIMQYRLRYTLPSNMLVKIDRMSMANSLEVRAPFLDLDLFNASLDLHDDLLVRGGNGKYILRKMMENDLPREVFDHPKTGFNIPLFKYQNEQFKRLAYRLLFDENPWPELIEKEKLREIYKSGIAAKKDTAKLSVFQSAHQLWMMMQLFGWAKRFKVQL